MSALSTLSFFIEKNISYAAIRFWHFMQRGRLYFPKATMLQVIQVEDKIERKAVLAVKQIF